METLLNNSIPIPSVRSSNRDAEGNILFRRDWLKDYVVINEAGTYEVVTTNAPTFYDPAEYGEEGNPRFIVNVKAVLQDNLPKLVELLQGKELIPISETNGLFMNGNIWINEDGEEPELPGKRETIKINVNFVEDRAGNDVLRITDINVLPTKKAEKLDLAALFAGDNMPGNNKKEA